LTSFIDSQNQAKLLINQFTGKLGVEIWQIFTIITMILSFASTFLWFGLVNPNSLKKDLENIDHAKALMYNAYQETFLELSAIGGHSVSSDFESCQIKFIQGYNNYKEQNTSIKNYQFGQDELEQNFTVEKKQFLNESGLVTTKEAFNDLFTQFSTLTISSEAQNKYQINLVNQIQNSCKEGKVDEYNQHFIKYLDSVGTLGFSSQFNSKAQALKESLFTISVSNTMETADLYSKILEFSPSFNDILSIIQPIEQNFLDHVQNLEKWQKNTASNNSYLKLKNFYIYDKN
jgi:hypothetical protein